MARNPRILSPSALQETGDVIRWYRQLNRGGQTHDGVPSSSVIDDQRVWVRTTTSTDHPTYPSDPSNKFVVEFGALSFTLDTTGDESAEFTVFDYATPDDNKIVAKSLGYLYEGAVVEAYPYNGRLWLRQPTWYWAKTGGTAITARSGTTPGSGTVTLQTLTSGVFAAVKDANDADATLTVKNGYGTASGTNAYVVVQLRELDGVGEWWYLEEDCE